MLEFILTLLFYIWRDFSTKKSLNGLVTSLQSIHLVVWVDYHNPISPVKCLAQTGFSGMLYSLQRGWSCLPQSTHQTSLTRSWHHQITENFNERISHIAMFITNTKYSYNVIKRIFTICTFCYNTFIAISCIHRCSSQ